MRISDWSSDVCSSDLACRSRRARQVATRPVIKHRIWSRTSAKEQKKPRIRGAFSCNHGTERLLRNHPHHLQALVRIAPLVVVPAHQLDEGRVEQIGRAHVCTPVTNAHLVCRLLLETKHTVHI